MNVHKMLSSPYENSIDNLFNFRSRKNKKKQRKPLVLKANFHISVIEEFLQICYNGRK